MVDAGGLAGCGETSQRSAVLRIAQNTACVSRYNENTENDTCRYTYLPSTRYQVPCKTSLKCRTFPLSSLKITNKLQRSFDCRQGSMDYKKNKNSNEEYHKP